MNRRDYVAMLTTAGMTTLSGCGAVKSVLGGGEENREEIKRVKNEAESPNWVEILQNMDEWKGEPVHYPGVRRESLSEMRNGSYVMTVDHPQYSSPGAGSLHCEWYGDREDITDTMDIWGTVRGTYTYAAGDEETVPDIHLVAIEPSG